MLKLTVELCKSDKMLLCCPVFWPHMVGIVGADEPCGLKFVFCWFST
jgi:hypothetical protein